MSFAIEVPGDANPLTIQSLCRVLQASTSASTGFSERQASGQQLSSWESQEGYYSSLQNVFLDKTIPYEIRFLAILQLKNGIEKYWRLFSHTKNGLKPPEKAIIRSKLFLGTVDEENKVLALHNALAVAKVFRIDFPQDWPDGWGNLVSLLRTARTESQKHLFGSLQILLRVVKEMATARLKKSQSTLQSITPEVLFLLGEIYAEQTQTWIGFLSGGGGDDAEADLAMLNSLVALKTLRRLVISGYETPYRDQHVQEFWSLSQTHFGQFLSFVSHDSAIPAPYQDVVGKHLLQFSKLHIDMAESHTASFAALPNSLPLVRAYWDLVSKFAEMFPKSGGIRHGSADNTTSSKSKVEGPLLERLALKGLIILRKCTRIAFRPITTFRYRSEEVTKEQNQAAELIKTELLKPDFVVQIIKVIITQLLIFRKADLEAWEEDPEEWEQQEQSEGNAYEWEVRPCAEKLFLDLLINCRDLLVPPLLEYFKSATNPDTDVATKEAVYTVMGLSVSSVINPTGLHSLKVALSPTDADVVNLDKLLQTVIVPDAQLQDPLAKILRRRIAILLSQWLPVHSTAESRPLVYEIYRHFMNPNDASNDIVVRITAARQLRWIADELAFDADAFLPFASDILTQLMELLNMVEVDEAKLAILETVRLVVTRMEDHAAKFGDFVMTAAPKLWQDSGSEEYMIKQAVIAIFSALVMSMGTESQRYQHLMIPLLAEAARPSSPLHTHLIDEALDLWNSLLMQSNPPLSAEIGNLLELLLPLLDYQSETAALAITAVESYIMLGPEIVLRDELRRPTLAALANALNSSSREMVRVATLCLEYLIRSAIEIGGEGGITIILQDMLSTGFLAKMLEDLHQAWGARQTTGPNRKASKLNTITEGDYFAILSRMILGDPKSFINALLSLGSLDSVWDWLGSEWFYFLEGMDNIERQKLYLLALTRLLELPEPSFLMKSLQDYMSMWLNIISDLQDGVTIPTDCLVWTNIEPGEYSTPKTVRENDLLLKDPIHSVVAADFVRVRFDALVATLGGQRAFEENWLVNVDKPIVNGFSELMQKTRTSGQ